MGTQLWIFHQKRRDFQVNFFKDANEFADVVFESKRTGALIIGGGVSKHHTLLYIIFS